MDAAASGRARPLSFLPSPPPGPVYDAAVARLRGMALAVRFYARPAAKASVSRARYGAAFVQPPHRRLVPVEDDMGAHISAALRLSFPQPEFDAPVPLDLMVAVDACLAADDQLPEWRAERMVEVEAVAASLASLNERIVQLATPSARLLVAGMNLAFMAAFIEAVGWPDVDVVRRFVFGFPIVGEVPDSGLHRPLDQPARFPLASFDCAANASWASYLKGSITAKAAAAAGDELEGLHELERVTRKEACAGYLRGPLTERQVDRLFGRGRWRLLRRFGVWQGEGDDRKLRAIDNAKTALCNAVTSLCETVCCITVFFVVLVAHYFAMAAAARRLPMPRLQIGLDDMRAAYRRIPVATPWHAVIGLWSFVLRRVVYYWLPGHCFGFTSSVVNFNRFPKLMVAMARVLFAVPCDHYFDDYIIVDVAAAGASGQECLAGAHCVVGQAVEPRKRKDMASSNVALGTLANVSRAASDGRVTLSPTVRRCRTVLAMLAAARAHNHLSSGEAGTIRGKLGWILTAAASRVGRAACQPLVLREHESAVEWTPALEQSYQFFAVLLDTSSERPALPPLEVSIHRHPRRPVVIYSDAMFRRVDGAPFSRVAWVAFIPGRRPIMARMVLPQWVYELLSPDSITLIQQAEIVAGLGAYRSLRHLLFDEAVVHFVDNTGALSNMVHGYARTPDCGRLVNSLHLALAALRCKVWFEWVPSKANVADLPSRDEDELLLDALDAGGVGAAFDEIAFDLPPFATWAAPLAEFAAV